MRIGFSFYWWFRYTASRHSTTVVFLGQLSPRIFSRIAYASWLVVADLAYVYADVLEYFVEFLSKVTECNSNVVWEVLFDEYVAVEAAHFWDCENTDTTE